MNKRSVFFASAVVALSFLSGCSSTPRGLQHQASKPVVVADAAQSASDQAFAALAGSLELGTTSIISATPLGMASVTVVDQYMNALGETCRRVEVKNQNESLKGAVCLGADKTWRFIRALQ